jgi:catechol 2,3-dioxygenase-like lactoylglutathione lyase family enzyme
MDWKLELVVVPVSDVERARRFYAGQVGFAVDHDTRIDDRMHDVQLTPPGSACSIAIGTGLVETPPGTLQAARAHLAEQGVEVSQVQHYEGADLVDGPADRH